jgi:hypothetical protein
MKSKELRDKLDEKEDAWYLDDLGSHLVIDGYLHPENYKLLRDYLDALISEQPDETDIWRENLKAWTLERDEKKDFNLYQVHAHYEGEF